MRDDLFDSLRSTEPGPAPLPAAEVRRRGDRARRRRNALQVVGAAAIVAVIAGGALKLAGDVGDRDTGPAPQPKQTQGTQTAPRIRDDFPLAKGWPTPDGDGSRQAPSRSIPQIEWSYCDLGKVTGFGDRLSTQQSLGSAGYARDLYTFATPEAAAAAFTTLAQKFDACTSWKDDMGTPHTAAAQMLEEGTIQYAAWNDAVYAGAVFVTQRGSALFVEWASTEGHGREMAEQVGIDQLDQVAPVTHLLCEFTAAGCDGIVEEDESKPVLGAIPLASGWPAGETTPLQDGPEIYRMCGVDADEVPRWTAWRGITSDGDGSRMRQVFVFDTAATATSMLDRIEQAACRREPLEAPNFRVGDVNRMPRDGGEVLQVTSWYENEAGEDVSGGYDAVNLVRHGRVVLMSYVGGEGAGRVPAEDAVAGDLQGIGSDLISALKELADRGNVSRGSGAAAPPANGALLTTSELTQALAEHPFVEGATAIPWKPASIHEDFTFGCNDQAADLGGLPATALDWTAQGAEARTITAIGDGEAATDAFNRLSAGLAACSGGATLHPVGDVEGRDGTENGSAWRVFTTSAPEICTACDTGRLIGMGVAKVGDQLVLVRIDLVVDLQLVGTDTRWVDAVLEKAASHLA